MTNKEFRNHLKNYPDDFIIQMDKTFGWEKPENKNLCDPHLYINTDFGFIEIEPDEYRTLWNKPEEKLPEDGDECVIKLCTVKENKKEYHNIFGTYSKEENTFYDYNGVKVEDCFMWMSIPGFDED